MEDSENSVGIVTPQRFVFDEPIALEAGGELEQYELVVETYGQLNGDASNAVLICHALSGNHHAAGKHSPEDTKSGWWDLVIGPGKPIDTDRLFVVSLNNWFLKFVTNFAPDTSEGASLSAVNVVLSYSAGTLVPSTMAIFSVPV